MISNAHFAKKRYCKQCVASEKLQAYNLSKKMKSFFFFFFIFFLLHLLHHRIADPAPIRKYIHRNVQERASPTTTLSRRVKYIAVCSTAGSAERHALIERDILADNGRLANHHAHAVIDEKPAANFTTMISMAMSKPINRLVPRFSFRPAAPAPALCAMLGQPHCPVSSSTTA